VILVIADATDEPALWLQRRLEPLVGMPVRRITARQLVLGSRFRWHMTSDASQSEVRLANGRLVATAQLAGVISRIQGLPTEPVARVAPADRDYVESELHALLLGWLAALPVPVLGAPSPSCLGGAWAAPAVARMLAAAAGLAADMSERPIWAAGNVAAIVLGGRIYGPLLPRPVMQALVRFAATYGGMVQVTLNRSENFAFVDATPYVDFQLGGSALLRTVAAMFQPLRAEAAE
jgi:hypothetical protein